MRWLCRQQVEWASRVAVRRDYRQGSAKNSDEDKNIPPNTITTYKDLYKHGFLNKYVFLFIRKPSSFFFINGSHPFSPSTFSLLASQATQDLLHREVSLHPATKLLSPSRVQGD